LGLNLAQLKDAGYDPLSLKEIGFTAAELKSVGFSAEAVMPYYSPGEILRAGYLKTELKPLGLFPHDGEWQLYNNYWSCCHDLDKKSKYCASIHKH